MDRVHIGGPWDPVQKGGHVLSSPVEYFFKETEITFLDAIFNGANSKKMGVGD